MLAELTAIAAWAQERPDDLAVVSHTRRFTVGELWDASRRLAGWLTERGLGADVPVATAVPTSLEPIALLALLIRGGAGASYVQGAPVEPTAPVHMLVTTEETFPGVARERTVRLDPREIDRIDPETVIPADPGLDEIVRIAYSSGTTGTPKAIALTRRQVEARCARPRDGGLVSDDVATMLRGTSYANQLGVITTLAARRPHLVLDRPEDALRLLAEFPPRVLQGAPAQLATLLRAAEQTGERLPELQAVMSVGAPLAPAIGTALIDWFEVDVIEGYGSTEGDVAYFRHWTGEGGGAELYPTTEAEVVGDDHRVLPDGEVGHLRVRSPGMADGYLDGDAGDEFHGFREGWFYSGDLAVLHGRRVTLIGRDDDVLNIGGQKLMPATIESAALSVPGIHEAAAVAVPDELGILRLALAVVAPAGVTRQDVADAVAPHADGVPLSALLRVRALPRTESGKVRRAEVVAMFADRARRG